MTKVALPFAHTQTRWLFASLHVTFGVLFLLYQLESMQKAPSGSWSFQGIGSLDGRWIILLLGGLFLINAWLIDGLLEHRTLQDGRTRPAPRVVRFLAAGIPLVGIYVLPVWFGFLDRKPAWAIAPLSSAAPPQQQRFLIFSSRAQWLRLSVPFFVWMLVINPLLSGAGIAWLGAHRATLFGAELTDAVTWMLRLLGLAVALAFVAAQRSRPLRVPQPVPWLLPFLWLLPFPWCFLGALVVVVFDPKLQSRSIVRQVFGGRRMFGSQLMELGRMDWWKLSRWQRLRWPSGRSPADPAEAEKRLVGLYRLKTFLLFPETALLTAGLVVFAVRVPFSQLLIHPLLIVIQLGALGSALLGGFLLIRSFLRGLFRSNSEPPSGPLDLTDRSLLLGGLAVLAGLDAGVALGHGEAASLARVLLNVGLVGMVAAGLLASPIRFGVSKVRHRPFPLIVWSGVFAVIGYAGSWIGSAGKAAPQALPLALTLLGLAPLASLSIGARSFPWLLHPLTLWHTRDERLPFRLRLALLVLTVTACIPVGGLAVPLWAAARRRLWPLATRLKETPEPPPPLPESGGRSMASLSPEMREYAFRNFIAHQARSGAAEALFHRIEAISFLADQSTCSGGFRRSSEDIEEHILPLALRSRDWERFLHYSSLAVNLRRIADDLAEPDLLPALARNGHRSLAADAAARISDPAQRALGRATLAASLDLTDVDRNTLVDQVRNDLGSLPPAETPEKEEVRVAALVQIGLLLGAEIEPSLTLHEGRPGLLRLSTAIGCLQRGGALDTEGWNILRKIQEEQILAQFLPDLLGNAAATVDPKRLLDLLATLFLGVETLWACRLAILATQVRTSPAEAHKSWEALRAAPPLPWSIPLIERGAPLFALLPEADFELEPLALTALRVSVLESNPSETADAVAQSALERLAPGSERLHWSLRRAAAAPIPEQSRRREIREIGRQLFQQRYQAPPEDLRRYLELVARSLPDELLRRAEDVVLSPGGGAPLLFHLVQTTQSSDLLEHLFRQVETYLASFMGLPELEGNRLWQALILQITPRLCALRGDLVSFEEAAERLRESDELAARVTGALAAAGQMELATHACGRIRPGRLRLATQLRWLPEALTSSRSLEPEPLYRALASVAPLEDEWLGLAALHDPDPPEILFQRYLDRIGDRDTQALTLFRLVRRLLDNPKAPRRGRRQGQLVLQMLGQALGAIQTDARLAAVLPWLPELVARVDPDRAIEEQLEAFSHLLTLHTVAWPIRRDAIEELLISLGSYLFTEGIDPRRTQSATELFARFETILAEGIPGQEEDVAADLLPVLTAALERLPGDIAVLQEQPLGSRLCFSGEDSEKIRMLCLCSVEERSRVLEWAGDGHLAAVVAGDRVSPSSAPAGAAPRRTRCMAHRLMAR